MVAASSGATVAPKSEENIFREEVENINKFFKAPGGMENQYAANWEEIQRKSLALPAQRQAVIEESSRLVEEYAAKRAAAAAKAAPVAKAETVVEDILGTGEEINEEQKGGGPDDDRVIILTSDQKVLLISLRKEKVISSLQTLMKSVAVDCQLNYQDNNDGTFRCMDLGDSIGDFAYHPNLQKDIQETEARFKMQPAQLAAAPVDLASMAAEASQVEAQVPKPKRIVYKRKMYFYKIIINEKNETKNPLGYLLFNTDDPTLLAPIGFVNANPDNKYLPFGEVGDIPEGIV